MKLAPAAFERIIATPDPSLRALLVYGPDGGLVRERADRMAAAIVPDRRDPFRVAELQADRLAANPARLYDEAQALSLMPGRRLVRVREAGDEVGPLFDRFLKALPPGDALILVEAGDLAARSSLRRAFESARSAGAVACYADGPDELATLVRSSMSAHRITVSGEAVEYLVANLGGDRLLSRQELDKLALYAGDNGAVGLEDAIAVVGDSAAMTVEDAIFAAAEGNAAALERALARAVDEGEAPVAVLRAAMRHFQRLHLAGTRVAQGARPDEAIERLRPPVFFKLRPRFLAALRLWPPRRAAAALETLLEAERQAKHTGVPPEPVCRDALLRLARGAQNAGARPRGGARSR